MVITLILILPLLFILNIWLTLQHIGLFETSLPLNNVLQFLISVHLAFIIQLKMYIQEKREKNKRKKIDYVNNYSKCGKYTYSCN